MAWLGSFIDALFRPVLGKWGFESASFSIVVRFKGVAVIGR